MKITRCIILVIFLASCSTKIESSKKDEIQSQPTIEKLSNGENKNKPSNSKQKDTNLLPDVTNFKVKTDEKIIWLGNSGNYFIKWTNQDLTYQSPSKTISLFSWMAEEDMKIICEDHHTPKEPCGCLKDRIDVCSIERGFQLLSVVGTLISFKDAYTGIGGTMLDARSLRHTTVDISKDRNSLYQETKYGMSLSFDSPKSNFAVSLTDLFDDKEILAELLKDESIHQILEEKEMLDGLRSASDLVKLIEERGQEILVDGYKYRLDEDFLTSFAFYDIENEKVLVKLSLPYARSSYNHKEIILKLTIPPKLKTPLTLAEQQKEGFLMKDADKISGKQNTRIEYRF